MSSLASFAQQFKVDSSKAFFPVNSLRLLYFMIAEKYVPGNEKLIDQINKAIPLVEATVNNNSPETIDALLTVVNSPKLKEAVLHFHATLSAIQSDILAALYRDFTADGPLNESHLKLLLRTRAIDSYLYATMISESIYQHTQFAGDKAEELTTLLESNLNTLYQLNDLVDSIVYAKDDIQADNFSPLQMMRKIAPQPQDTKTLIKEIQEQLSEKIQIDVVKSFRDGLIQTLG